MLRTNVYISDVVKREISYEQLNAVQERLSKENMRIVLGNLNAKVDSDNILVEHTMRKHVVGDGNDNGGRFAYV